MAELWCVVGLGNPGPTYAGNRHNVGQMVLDELARRAHATFSAHRARAAVADARLVVHDEVDIPFDTLKLKIGGGEGGHNGLRDISKALGTKDYIRVRVGVGRPPGRMETADFVLKDFATTERKDLPFIIDRAADAVERVISDGLLAAQGEFHTKL